MYGEWKKFNLLSIGYKPVLLWDGKNQIVAVKKDILNGEDAMLVSPENGSTMRIAVDDSKIIAWRELPECPPADWTEEKSTADRLSMLVKLKAMKSSVDRLTKLCGGSSDSVVLKLLINERISVVAKKLGACFEDIYWFIDLVGEDGEILFEHKHHTIDGEIIFESKRYTITSGADFLACIDEKRRRLANV